MASNLERELARLPGEELISEITLHYIADATNDYPAIEQQMAQELLEAREEIERLRRVVTKWAEVFTQFKGL